MHSFRILTYAAATAIQAEYGCTLAEYVPLSGGQGHRSVRCRWVIVVDRHGECEMVPWTTAVGRPRRARRR